MYSVHVLNAKLLVVDAFVLGDVFEGAVILCAACRPPEETLLLYTGGKARVDLCLFGDAEPKGESAGISHRQRTALQKVPI